MHVGNEVVMDRCGIMSMEKMPSVLHGDPSCENSGVNAALRACYTLSRMR